MQKILLAFLILPLNCFSQLTGGVKAGLNLTNVTSSPDLSTNLYAGYFIGGYIAPKQKGVVGYRSELMLSRQGYDYKSGTNTGNVDLDYLLLPQLVVFKFSKKFQLQLGGQIAFLLNTAVDSSGGSNNGSLFNYFKRFDYGAVGGFEVSPFSGFFIGSRLNVSLHNIGKEPPTGGNNPNFVPKDLIRNNVLQVYIGWRF